MINANDRLSTQASAEDSLKTEVTCGSDVRSLDLDLGVEKFGEAGVVGHVLEVRV
jgi:hypothetical protein